MSVPKLLTRSEVADILGIRRERLSRFHNKGLHPHPVIPGRYHEDVVRAFVEMGKDQGENIEWQSEDQDSAVPLNGDEGRSAVDLPSKAKNTADLSTQQTKARLGALISNIDAKSSGN